jgi:hypothetical protein
MNLICPHCQKTVTLPEELAGQTSKCPECNGPFTVPLSSPAPAGAVVGLSSSAAALQSPKAPASPLSANSPATPGLDQPKEKTSPPVSSGGSHPRFSIALNPHAARWTAPVCFLFILVFFFFPWLTTGLDGKFAFTQTGIGAAFGISTPREELRAAPWMIPYFLLILAGVLTGAAALAATVVLPALNRTLPPALEPVLRNRSYIFAAISLLTFFALLLQMLMGFPAESKAFAVPEDLAGLATRLLQRTMWIRAVFSLNLLAVVGALADFWLERRLSKPLPRLVAEW